MAVAQELLLPSPAKVIIRLFQLLRTSEFYLTCLGTLGRVILGFIAGSALGGLLALAAHFSKVTRDLIHPALTAIRSTPVASFILLALVWVGRAWVPPLTSALICMPVVWGATSASLAETDKSLLEMAHVFKLGRSKTLRYVYLPSAKNAFFSSCSTALGLAWKSGIAAEVLSSTLHSIGGAINDAKIYLETADLMAWTLVVILLSLVFEWLLKRVVRLGVNV